MLTQQEPKVLDLIDSGRDEIVSPTKRLWGCQMMQALAIYQRELSDYQVIPIECTLIANGGGGINCTSHEIPAISTA